MRPKLVIQGGAGKISKSVRRERAFEKVVEKAREYFKDHSALETVVFTVKELEDSPYFNAGTGSALQKDKRARMSAAVMDSERNCLAGVINIEDVKNPILVAEKLLENESPILAGRLATKFARKIGFKKYDPINKKSLRRWQKKAAKAKGHGTVGAVALDADGVLAAATSTGGRGYETPGRVSDSAIPSGNYVSFAAAVSCTGYGEAIVNSDLACRIVCRVEDGMTLKRAVARSFKDFEKLDGRGGIIAIDKKGKVEVKFNTPGMSYAII